MTPIYVKTGVLFRDSIVVQTGSGTFVTGLVDGDFTKQLSNGTTGGVSATGITVTEVSSGSNPGVYDVLIPASILATNGNYTLKLYRTADLTYAWAQEYVATQDGLPGSTGTLSFTAIAGDGRVVDTSSTAIAGATVYLSNNSGYLVGTTTNASGVWGPIYFSPSFGTVTVTVVKTGYVVATSSLTVGVGSVTGPGIDIALAATASASNTQASTLWAHARRMSGNKSGTQADTRIKGAVNDALDRLAKEWDSPWYLRRGSLSLDVPYSTGTVALTNGSTTVTLTGGTFPSWAASGKLIVDSKLYDIASRDSSTQLTLLGAYAGTSASYSYQLVHDAYALPANFLKFGGIMQGQTYPWLPEPVSIEGLWTQQNAWQTNQQYSNIFAIAYGKVYFWPAPSQTMNVAYWYKARPAPLTTDTDLADVDPVALDTLYHLINYYVAVYFGECVAGTTEQCMKMYQDSLARLMANDKSPEGIGNRRVDPNTRNPFAWWNNRP